ncbi:metallophosphoesterase [Halomonas sediminis]
MRLIQITDAHLHADPQGRSRAGLPWRQFRTVIESVIAERPAVVVVSGDVSQDATSASYILAKETLSALPCPWFWLPGNHDQPELMKAVHPLHDDVDLEHWHMVLLDTRVEGREEGELGPERLAAFAECLEQDARPTLVVLHHPPVAVGSAWMDRIGLQDREVFWQMLSAYPQVKLVLFGHAHQAFAHYQVLNHNPVGVYGCPATADQFLAGAKDFALDQAARPGYRIVDLHDGDWLTWVERVDI